MWTFYFYLCRVNVSVKLWEGRDLPGTNLGGGSDLTVWELNQVCPTSCFPSENIKLLEPVEPLTLILDSDVQIRYLFAGCLPAGRTVVVSTSCVEPDPHVSWRPSRSLVGLTGFHTHCYCPAAIFTRHPVRFFTSGYFLNETFIVKIRPKSVVGGS